MRACRPREDTVFRADRQDYRRASSRSHRWHFCPRHRVLAIVVVVVDGSGVGAARRQILNRDRREIEKLLPS